MLRYFGCEHGVNRFPVFTCLSYRIKKSKKTTTFKLIKLLKHTQKHAVSTEDRILIRHYRLDKSIEPENMPPNNPGLNPADYSILANLSQRLYKHQRIRDMQHLKDLLEEKREELSQYESDACINQFRYRLLKVIEVAGKHIIEHFLLLNEMCDCCLSWHVQVIYCHC